MASFYGSFGLYGDSFRSDNIISSSSSRAVSCSRGRICFEDISTPIPNLVLTSTDTKSWIVLIGVPMINGIGDEAAIQRFLARFFEAPEKLLRNEIDGHFALFAYDAKTLNVYFATDYNSFIPVYFSKQGDYIYFSSSEATLAKELNLSIDAFGLMQAVHLGSTWGEQARFKGAEKLRACELGVLRGINVSKSCYWNPRMDAPWTGHFDDVLSQWGELLNKSVQLFSEYADNYPLSADLTGGEDSRLIVAQCHALGLSVPLRVLGFPGDPDISIAQACAKKTALNLNVETYSYLSEDELDQVMLDVCLSSDGYGSFFTNAIFFATHQNRRPLEYSQVHLCGMPGGEAFRGSYYLRAGVLFPAHQKKFNIDLFLKFKYLLDCSPDLMTLDHSRFYEQTRAQIEFSLHDVDTHLAATQVDHLLRVFQTCTWGGGIKQPFYLPLGLRDMTRSIYQMPPGYKSSSKITRACTEALFPQLAFIKTEMGVPTIRKTCGRFLLFLPEHMSGIKKLTSSVQRRLFKFGQEKKSLSMNHRKNHHQAMVMKKILNSGPYAAWFKSSDTMLTGEHYHAQAINKMLASARAGQCSQLVTLGRVINQEILCRYVCDDEGAV